MSIDSRQTIITQLNQAVQHTGNRTVMLTHAIASRIGLSASEFECLDLIQAFEPVPSGKLAQLTGLSTGAITGLVDRLERAGFVRRLPDPTDRRRVLIEAIEDEDATSRVRALYQPLVDGFDELVKRYSDADILVITDYLNRSVTLVDAVCAQMRDA